VTGTRDPFLAVADAVGQTTALMFDVMQQVHGVFDGALAHAREVWHFSRSCRIGELAARA
jgi:hypothetical protein